MRAKLLISGLLGLCLLCSCQAAGVSRAAKAGRRSGGREDSPRVKPDGNIREEAEKAFNQLDNPVDPTEPRVSEGKEDDGARHPGQPVEPKTDPLPETKGPVVEQSSSDRSPAPIRDEPGASPAPVDPAPSPSRSTAVAPPRSGQGPPSVAGDSPSNPITLSLPGVVTGTMHSGELWYAVVPEGDAAVHFSLKNTTPKKGHHGASLSLALLDGQLQEYAHTKSRGPLGKSDVRLVFVPGGAPCLLKLMTPNPQLQPSYSIEVGAKAVGRRDQEPNGAWEQAQPIRLPTQVDGKIGLGADQEDWFAFTAPSSGELSLVYQNDAAAWRSSGKEKLVIAKLGKLELLDSDLSSLGEIKPMAAGKRPKPKRWTLEAGAKYYLKVNSLGKLRAAPYKLLCQFQ